MPRTNQDWLQSIAASAQHIAAFTAGLSFADYALDAKTQAAVERHFGIIGEALTQLEQQDPDTAASISGRREIIGMRIVLTHRFYDVDAHVVWETAINGLPLLRAEVRQLLNSAAAEP